MKSKTLILATLLLVTVFLLMQAIVPHAALAATGWTNTNGGVSGYQIDALAYDSVHNVLYAGLYEQGVWSYNGTTWTEIRGGAGSSPPNDIASLVYDSVHNVLYAGTNGYGVYKYNGKTWTLFSGSANLSNYTVASLAYDSVHNLLYAGTSGALGTGNGVWKYNGTKWTNTGAGMSGQEQFSLAYDSVDNLLYAGTSGQGVWEYSVGPASTFYFAEGTCRPGFDPYFCLQNPGSVTANVTLTYMKGDGTTATDTVTVPKNSRITVSPRSALGTGNDAAHDFSTKVTCTNGRQIIAERPMYFNYNGWTGGHDAMGFVP